MNYPAWKEQAIVCDLLKNYNPTIRPVPRNPTNKKLGIKKREFQCENHTSNSYHMCRLGLSNVGYYWSKIPTYIPNMHICSFFKKMKLAFSTGTGCRLDQSQCEVDQSGQRRRHGT